MNKTEPRALVFWDTQDPGNPGWAYRLYDADGQETDSGPICYDMPRDSPDGEVIAQAADDLHIQTFDVDLWRGDDRPRHSTEGVTPQ